MKDMNRCCIFAVVGLMAGLTGCAATRITTSQMMPELVYKGFAIQRPADERWYVNPGEQEAHHALFRIDLPSPSHTFFASVKLSSLPREPQSTSDLKALVEKSFQIGDTNRFTLVELTLSITNHQGETSIHYVERTMDKGTASRRPLMIVQRGYMTPHPDNKKVVLDAFYSERGFEGEINAPECVTLGEAFLSGVRFMRVRK